MACVYCFACGKIILLTHLLYCQSSCSHSVLFSWWMELEHPLGMLKLIRVMWYLSPETLELSSCWNTHFVIFCEYHKHICFLFLTDLLVHGNLCMTKWLRTLRSKLLSFYRHSHSHSYCQLNDFTKRHIPKYRHVTSAAFVLQKLYIPISYELYIVVLK